MSGLETFLQGAVAKCDHHHHGGRVLLALFGYLLVGKEGLVNGAGWGLILGLMSVPFSGFAIWSRYWGEVAGRAGTWWIQKETEGDE